MPAPKNPEKYALWIERQRKAQSKPRPGVSLALTGRTYQQSPAQKAASDRRKNIPRPLSVGIAVSKALTGRYRSEEHCRNNSIAQLARNGGVRKQPKQCKEYYDFQENVLNRDVNTCQRCGVTEGAYKELQTKRGVRTLRGLDVHHTYPWDDFPEFWYDVSKGRSLCPPCHRVLDAQLQEDKRLGRGIYEGKTNG